MIRPSVALLLVALWRAACVHSFFSTCTGVQDVFIEQGCCGSPDASSTHVNTSALCSSPLAPDRSSTSTCAEVERVYIDDGCCDSNAPHEAIVDVSALCAPPRTLVWSDEFDAAGAVDAAKWHHQTLLPNGYSWYNAERQHYTSRVENANVEGGVLRIIAIAEPFADQGVTKQYTSARLNSKFAFRYGEVEVRAKLPEGSMTWPAIWMLGKSIDEPGAYWQTQGLGTTPWPACGEVDIMEHWGHTPNVVQSAIHTPSSFGGTIHKGGQSVATATSDFHVYRLVWTETHMIFSVDGVEHYRYHPPVKNAATWPFDTEQYLLLNVAIHGAVDPTFTSAAMVVDYVRIYQ